MARTWTPSAGSSSGPAVRMVDRPELPVRERLVMSWPTWTDAEIEDLSHGSADRARAMIGDWLRADPDEHEVEWVPSRWSSRVDISTLPEQLRREGRIRRRDLFDLAGQVTAGSGDRTVVALLIGVVAWGSGKGIRRAGGSDGDPRGPWRAQQALSLPTSDEAIMRIRRAVEASRRYGGQTAYAALSLGGAAKLSAMGESFFTKLIYVSAHRALTTPRPAATDPGCQRAQGPCPERRHSGVRQVDPI